MSNSSENVDDPVAAFVIPAFNSQSTLVDTVESALRQTEPRIEVVVVNDGSTDRTGEIANALATKDARVQVLHQTNHGLSDARNNGLRRVRAPYVCFLDADDLVSEDKVSLQVGSLESNPDAAIVYSASVTFEDGHPESLTPFESPTNGNALVDSLRTGGIAFPPHAAMFRKSTVIRYEGFKNLVQLGEDIFFWTRLALGGETFVYIPEVTAFYRLSKSSMSANMVKRLDGRLALIRWLEENDATATRDIVLRRESRRRYLTLILGGYLDQYGRRWESRRVLSRELWRSRRLGEFAECLRLLAWPQSILKQFEPQPVSDAARATTGHAAD